MEGSAFYAANPPRSLPIDHVVHMVNLDMIGTYSDEAGVEALGTTAGTPGRTILQGLVGKFGDLDVKIARFARWLQVARDTRRSIEGLEMS